jgi:hypothetical protein
MSDLEQIKTKIATTKAELATAKSKLAQAVGVGNEAEVDKYEDQVLWKLKLLTLQQEKEILLLKASLGNVIIA